MNGRSKFAVGIALVFSLAGCVGTGAISSDTRSSMRTIAVTSALGNTFHGVLIGTTVFNNVKWEADVREWKVDESAIQIVQSYLERNGGIKAISIGTGFVPTNLGSMLSAAQKVGADTLILIKPASFQDDYPPGFGFHRRSMLGMGRNCIYSLFLVEVYSVPSGRKMGTEWSWSAASGVQCYGDVPWKDEYSAYGAEERNLLRQAVTMSLGGNIRIGMKALELIP